MLTLISAPPRTGKTLKCIEEIFKCLNEGKIVYTNIVGIKIPGVFKFSSSTEQPHDWRDLDHFKRIHPELSDKSIAVFYDEAHEHPAFADRNLIQDKKRMAEVRDIGISLTLHGHFGFDVYLITQNPRLLCPEVLACVGTHYIMRRKFGYDFATIFEYAEAKTTFSKHTAKDALNRTYWKYPKHLYNYYVSSEVHNIKKTFPVKYYGWVALIIGIFGLGTYKAYQTGFFGLIHKDKSVTAENKQPAPQDPTDNTYLTMGVNQKSEPTPAPDCNDINNNHLPICIDINKQKQDQLNAEIRANNAYIDYNPADPYRAQQVTYTATAQPVFAGCAKWGRKYVAYTQQGTIIHDFKESDCRKLIDQGDRPFNYFGNGNQQTAYSRQEPTMTTDNKPMGQSVGLFSDKK